MALVNLAHIFRYPVKSMLGEELAETEVTTRGLDGDRRLALFDPVESRIVSAKAAHKWPLMFRFRAELANGAARIVFPDGSALLSDSPDIHARLTAGMGREVRLVSDSVSQRTVDMVYFDPEHPEQRDVATFDLSATGFFDSRPVHLLTTATLAKLRRLYPEGDFAVARFRPNLLVETVGEGFLENQWVGRTVAIGDSVLLRIDKPCARCIMTTLPQGELPPDTGILRTAARHNHAHIGVLASVVRAGRIRSGDSVAVRS
jgi:uncharacterized protein YcbX